MPPACFLNVSTPACFLNVPTPSQTTMRGPRPPPWNHPQRGWVRGYGGYRWGVCRGRRPRRPADLLKMPSYTVRAVEDAGPYEMSTDNLARIGNKKMGRRPIFYCFFFFTTMTITAAAIRAAARTIQRMGLLPVVAVSLVPPLGVVPLLAAPVVSLVLVVLPLPSVSVTTGSYRPRAPCRWRW